MANLNIELYSNCLHRCTSFKLASGGKLKMPEIFMACGIEDFLIEPNRAMHNFLEDNGVKHVYWEDKGVHDMEFWDKCVHKFIPMMME